VVRDKDGVAAAAVFAELAATLAAQGRTVLDQLDRLYREYGLYVSKQVSHWHRCLDGEARIAELMARLRSAPPRRVGDLDVHAVRDYLHKLRVRADGTREPLGLPSSNVLAFDLAGGSRVVARPSGTEPKIKFYVDHREQVHDGEPMHKAQRRAAARLQELTEAFLALAS
jgi:phosphomannomutase